MIINMIILLIVYYLLFAYSSVLIPVNEDNITTKSSLYIYLNLLKIIGNVQQRENIITNILGLMKVFSKKPTLVPMVIRCEWPNACIQWLENNWTTTIIYN